jgi:hypothetical protein
VEAAAAAAAVEPEASEPEVVEDLPMDEEEVEAAPARVQSGGSQRTRFRSGRVR